MSENYETSDMYTGAWLLHYVNQGSLTVSAKKTDATGRVWVSFSPAEEAYKKEEEYKSGKGSISPYMYSDLLKNFKALCRSAQYERR